MKLMPSGYTLTEEIWDYAEPFSGPTVAWLTLTAKRLNIYLGTSFLEADSEDFHGQSVNRSLLIASERKLILPEKLGLFRSPEANARFDAAYQAVLNQWPVPYEALYIPTRFGDTHVIARGDL